MNLNNNINHTSCKLSGSVSSPFPTLPFKDTHTHTVAQTASGCSSAFWVKCGYVSVDLTVEVSERFPVYEVWFTCRKRTPRSAPDRSDGGDDGAARHHGSVHLHSFGRRRSRGLPSAHFTGLQVRQLTKKVKSYVVSIPSASRFG